MQMQANWKQPVDKWMDPGCVETLSVAWWLGVTDDCGAILWVSLHARVLLWSASLLCLSLNPIKNVPSVSSKNTWGLNCTRKALKHSYPSQKVVISAVGMRGGLERDTWVLRDMWRSPRAYGWWFCLQLLKLIYLNIYGLCILLYVNYT